MANRTAVESKIISIQILREITNGKTTNQKLIHYGRNINTILSNLERVGYIIQEKRNNLRYLALTSSGIQFIKRYTEKDLEEQVNREFKKKIDDREYKNNLKKASKALNRKREILNG